MALTPSILKLKTSPSRFKLLRYRVKNVVFTAGLLLQRFVRNLRKTDFVFQIPAYLQQCLLKVGGDLKDKIGFSKITHKPLEKSLAVKTTFLTQYLSNLNPEGEVSSSKIDGFMANCISKLKWAWQA